jgi:transposase
MRCTVPSIVVRRCHLSWKTTLLRLAGTSPDRARIFNALTAFYRHCADSGIHQLRRLVGPSTLGGPRSSRARAPGISNGRTAGYHRIVKHIGRTEFGFRNTENHKRCMRFACTRISRARQ